MGHLTRIKEAKYFDHDADIGIIGRGETIETCFADAAYALFSLMADLSHVHQLQILTFEFEEPDIEIAFVRWLNMLIAKAQQHKLILGDFRLKRTGNIWQATVAGEKWHQDIERGIEVKGATLTMLSVKKTDHLWEAKCVVDV